MRIIGIASVTSLITCIVGCVDLSTICPHKAVTQGVFGEIIDESNTLEQNVEVDIYTMVDGMQGSQFGSADTTRGGYQFNADPGTYILCSKSSCAPVTVPTGIVDMSAIDSSTGLTWDAAVAVPPDQTIGPCKFGD